MAGLAVLGAVSTSYVTHATSLVLARESGGLRRWRISPLPVWCFFAGKALATALLGCACAVATVLVAASMGDYTSPEHVLMLLFPIALGVLCWATIATAISGLVPSGAAAYPVLTATYLPLVIISGAMGTPSGEPSWLRTVADCLPVHPVVEACVAALGGTWPIWSVSQLAVVLGWAAVAAAAVPFLFQWATPSRGAASRRMPSSRSEPVARTSPTDRAGRR